MTIILKFTDQEVTRPNAKSARGWLRNHNMNVAQATKTSEAWVFDFSLADPVLYVKGTQTTRPQIQPKVKPNPDAVALTKSRSAVLPDRPKKKERRNFSATAVIGSDLQPGDCLLNFAKYYNLTVDHRGIHQVVHSASNVTRQRQEYLGFYSQESGGLLSYRVEPEGVYDVQRS